ncbi:hypothetical protein GQR58_030081 [Nymphon striatum]|nr:hypothetical protein GQR58_030081 [Nymphon striatum]
MVELFEQLLSFSVVSGALWIVSYSCMFAPARMPPNSAPAVEVVLSKMHGGFLGQGGGRRTQGVRCEADRPDQQRRPERDDDACRCPEQNGGGEFTAPARRVSAPACALTALRDSPAVTGMPPTSPESGSSPGRAAIRMAAPAVKPCKRRGGQMTNEPGHAGRGGEDVDRPDEGCEDRCRCDSLIRLYVERMQRGGGQERIARDLARTFVVELIFLANAGQQNERRARNDDLVTMELIEQIKTGGTRHVVVTDDELDLFVGVREHLEGVFSTLCTDHVVTATSQNMFGNEPAHCVVVDDQDYHDDTSSSARCQTGTVNKDRAAQINDQTNDAVTNRIFDLLAQVNCTHGIKASINFDGADSNFVGRDWQAHGGPIGRWEWSLRKMAANGRLVADNGPVAVVIGDAGVGELNDEVGSVAVHGDVEAGVGVGGFVVGVVDNVDRELMDGELELADSLGQMPAADRVELLGQPRPDLAHGFVVRFQGGCSGDRDLIEFQDRGGSIDDRCNQHIDIQRGRCFVGDQCQQPKQTIVGIDEGRCQRVDGGRWSINAGSVNLGGSNHGSVLADGECRVEAGQFEDDADGVGGANNEQFAAAFSAMLHCSNEFGEPRRVDEDHVAHDDRKALGRSAEQAVDRCAEAFSFKGIEASGEGDFWVVGVGSVGRKLHEGLQELLLAGRADWSVRRVRSGGQDATAFELVVAETEDLEVERELVDDLMGEEAVGGLGREHLEAALRVGERNTEAEPDDQVQALAEDLASKRLVRDLGAFGGPGANGDVAAAFDLRQKIAELRERASGVTGEDGGEQDEHGNDLRLDQVIDGAIGKQEQRGLHTAANEHDQGLAQMAESQVVRDDQEEDSTTNECDGGVDTGLGWLQSLLGDQNVAVVDDDLAEQQHADRSGIGQDFLAELGADLFFTGPTECELDGQPGGNERNGECRGCADDPEAEGDETDAECDSNEHFLDERAGEGPELHQKQAERNTAEGRPPFQASGHRAGFFRGSGDDIDAGETSGDELQTDGDRMSPGA